MTITYDQKRAGYGTMWNNCKVKAEEKAIVSQEAKYLIAVKERYQNIEITTGVPWFLIGALHMRESNNNFKTHLHCGDPLTARTVHVPKGYPKTGNPPFTFEESAIDALMLKGLHKVAPWTAERILYECERYNGWGYMNKGRPSPYVWSKTNQYSKGKYVADGKYDPNTVDKQIGTAAVIKVLCELDPGVAKKMLTQGGKNTPNDVSKQIEDEKTKGAKNARNIAAGATAVTGTSEVTGLKTSAPVETGYDLMPIAVGVAIATILVTIFVIAKRKAEAQEIAKGLFA